MEFEHKPERTKVGEEEFWKIVNEEKELTDEEYERAIGLIKEAESWMEDRHGEDWEGWDNLETKHLDPVDTEIVKVMRHGHLIEKADVIFDVIDTGMKTEKGVSDDNYIYNLMKDEGIYDEKQ